jgi:hypothetical protein
MNSKARLNWWRTSSKPQHLILHRDIQLPKPARRRSGFRLHRERPRNADTLALPPRTGAGNGRGFCIRRKMHHRHQVARALQGFLAPEAKFIGPR